APTTGAAGAHFVSPAPYRRVPCTPIVRSRAAGHIFCTGPGAPPDLRSFPTRRSSDLSLRPALGACATFTVTVALSAAQGAVPVTLYLYTKLPAAEGMNTPLLLVPPGPVQLPPASGVPARLLKRFAAASVLHRAMVLLPPATGLRCCVTVTTAEALAHGLRPATV